MNIAVLVGAIAVAVALSIAILYGFHRLGKRDVLLADTTRGAGVYAVVGTSFAVLLAFVVLVAFESFNDARSGAQNEADATLEMSHTLEFFPRADHQPIQGVLICYARGVIDQDWPAMRDQTISPETIHWGLKLDNSFTKLPVDNLRQQAGMASLLSINDDRINARRDRLTQAEPLVTTPVWIILLIGAALNIGFVLVFIDRRSEGFAVQAFMIGALTAVVVGGLLLVRFLDHPYENANGSVKPVEMRRTLTSMETEHRDVPVPCTPSGAPHKRLSRVDVGEQPRAAH